MTPIIFQPTNFQQQILPTVPSDPLAGLPTTGLAFVYNLNYASSWPGSGRTVTDLSGNGFNGTLFGSVDSASAGLSFPGSTARIEVGGFTAFYNFWNNNKNLMIGIQYEQTASWGKNTSFASTWDTLDGFNNGYQFFLDVLSNGNCDTGVQLYAPAQGFYTTGGTVTTSSGLNTIVFRATSNSVTVHVNNSQIQNYTTNATKAFYYGTASGDYGKKILIGNRLSGENFAGRIRKVVCYNTADQSASTINTWLSAAT